MKKVSVLSIIALFAIVVSSCGSSNNVVSNHGISKRKYNKGFFFQRKSNLKTANTKVKDAEFDGDKTLAKTEKVKAKKATSKKSKVTTRKSTLENSNIAKVESTHLLEKTVINEEVQETQHFLYEGEDGIESSVTESQHLETSESIDEMPYENRNQSPKKSSGQAGRGDIDIVILVILAIIIPPLAVFLYEDITTRFWIDLILALVGYGVGFGLLGGVGGLLGLAAIIYALLIVLEVI